MPMSPHRHILPYLPELRRMAIEMEDLVAQCEKDVTAYQEAVEPEGDIVSVIGAIEDLVSTATRLLLTTRAGALAAHNGRNTWVP